MIKLAKILHIDDVNVTLKLERDNQCSDCESHCSDGFLRFLFNKKNKGELIVARSGNENRHHLVDKDGFFNQGYNVNDIIGLNFDETNLLKLTSILYGLPILLVVLMLIAGYLAFDALSLNADSGGVIGFIIGLLLAKFIIQKNHQKIQPSVKFFK